MIDTPDSYSSITFPHTYILYIQKLACPVICIPNLPAYVACSIHYTVANLHCLVVQWNALDGNMHIVRR